jgi:hypothetical protein
MWVVFPAFLMRREPDSPLTVDMVGLSESQSFGQEGLSLVYVVAF